MLLFKAWTGAGWGAPVSFEASGVRFNAAIVPPFAGGLIIAMLSALTAKRIMAPLNRLLLATNKVGASREVVPVADSRLGEFAPVGEAFEDMQRRLCLYDSPDHAELMAHPVALKRAFSNLIDNAVKYGGTAGVQLAKEESLLVVHIEDDGPGIPSELAEDAFTPFRRLDPANSNNVPGVGLGLTIARDVILSHGGKIALGSTDHPGLVVEVTFPSLESASEFRAHEQVCKREALLRQRIGSWWRTRS